MQIKTRLIDEEESFLNDSSTLSRPHQEQREDPHSNTKEKGEDEKEKPTNYFSKNKLHQRHKELRLSRKERT